MNKILHVLKYEFLNTITRRSFLLTLILVPLIPALILGGISLFGGGTSSKNGSGGLFEPSQEQLTEGYVDNGAIISTLPEDVAKDRLIAYPNTEDARQAVIDGKISGYYVIQSDYLQTGSIQYVRDDFNPLSALDTTGLINYVIRFNLLGVDQKQFDIYANPLDVEQIDLNPNVVERDQSSPLAFFVPYGVTMLFYVLIITSASLMMNSVAKEKENRVMEILMSSIKPNQLLAGKILGLGLIGLLQMILWVGSAFLMLRLGGTTLNIPPSLQPGPQVIYWGIIFFVLGYLIYATIMAGVGALVPNVKEATQATFYVILPILVPLFMIGVIIERPNALLPVILSLIPFTAPNTMMTRLAVGAVPLWQLLTAVALMVLTVIILIRAVAGMFRAQLLLTGKKFSPRLYFKALFGREIETLPDRES